MFYVYSFLLVLIFVVLYKSISSCGRAVPTKIRLLSIGAILALTLRYFVVLILFLINNIKYLYLLKPIYLLNYIGIPILALITLYILGRSDRIKFNIIYIIISAIILVYVLAMFISTSKVMLTQLGYTISIGEPKYFGYGYILLNLVFVVIAGMLLKKRHINKFGVILAFTAAIAAFIELLLRASGIGIFPQNIIGDVMWMVVFSYAIGQFKK